MKTPIIILIMSLLIFNHDLFAECDNGIDCPEPKSVISADIPDNGWYWAAVSDKGVSGWGINIEVQQSSTNASGYFVFGAFYTFDENNKAIWYTFTGDYLPAPDVYAWRENRGEMGSVMADVKLSDGGSCLTCVPRISSTSELADVGPVTISWQNPMQASVFIGDIRHEISRFKWHNGAGVDDISFITNGWWQIYFQTKLKSRNMFNEPLSHYQTLHGLAKFESFDTSIFDNHDVAFYNPEHVYYISSESNFLNASSFYSYGHKFIIFSSQQLLLDYDPVSHRLSLHYYSRIKPYEVDYCNYVISGYLRPSNTHNSVFYANNDERCDFADLSIDEDRRTAFAFMTHVGHIGDTIINNGLFTFNHGD